MRLGDMFYKDINRDIKGVIKIGQDDETNMYQELEEYVVTRELSEHFNTFFEAYNQAIGSYTDKMGIWISGFFGSGKSHFLKILSYLLENREVKGKKAVSYFDDKINDPMVLADIKKAGEVSKDVILFNIDSKSDSESKVDKESVLRVFNKVFNEMRGFCGTLPWLAELERQMVKEGTYEAFKSRFEELAGSPWEETREDFYFEEDNIVQALAETTKMSEESARNWFHKAEENFSLSIERFANKVKEYIESKDNEHHVLFMVDEMGQYIGDDHNLLLNLQTLIEDLGTHCGGKAWVVVTSQQDIDAITRVKGSDFSKIQDRFDTRLSLSSANVDEVIRKRILAKNDVGKDTLKLLYSDKEAILKNLITFSSDTPEMKTYQDEEDFIKVYPFIPYHFRLLQAVFTAIRQHGASGKHLSEGERSLLSAFKEAGSAYVDHEDGTLIPFSAFYDTIETFLDHDIRTVIVNAEDNDRLSDLDVEVLKVLFMIKWVKEMPANLENLATLMVRHTDDDKIELKKQIEGSLDRLVKETLVQKVGEEYVFLTHEEQDVNKEIRNMPVEIKEIVRKIGEEIFWEVYGEKKYKYDSRYHFEFNKQIDEIMIASQKSELGIKVITPYYETDGELSDEELRMMSGQENYMIIKLPSDIPILEEMEEILRIQKYLQKKGSTTQTEAIEEIKARKSHEISNRKNRLSSLLTEALKEADYYVNTQKLDLNTKNPVGKIDDGLRILVESVYSKLNYVKDFVDNDKELNDLLHKKEEQITIGGKEDDPNKLALEEVDQYIEMSSQRHIPITMKTILDKFTDRPFGWREEDITALIIKLLKSQEIRLQLGSDYLDTTDKNLIQYLTKRDSKDRVKVQKRKKTPEKYIKNAKDLSKKLFNVTALSSDEDSLMEKFKEFTRNELQSVNELLHEYKHYRYPGKVTLDKGQEIFNEILQIKDPTEFFEKLYERKEELLDYEEDVADIKNFFNNQREIFDNAVKQLNIYEQNRTYVVDKETNEIVDQIQNIINMKEPYSYIQKLPALIEDFRYKFSELLEKECQPIRKHIEGDWQKVKEELNKYDFKDELMGDFKQKFDNLLERLDSSNNFYEAIAMKEESDRLKQRCFDKIYEMQKPEEPSDNEGEEQKLRKKEVRVSVTNIIHGAKNIESEEDIDEVLEYVREQLKSQLDENTKIKLI